MVLRDYRVKPDNDTVLADNDTALAYNDTVLADNDSVIAVLDTAIYKLLSRVPGSTWHDEQLVKNL